MLFVVIVTMESGKQLPCHSFPPLKAPPHGKWGAALVRGRGLAWRETLSLKSLDSQAVGSEYRLRSGGCGRRNRAHRAYLWAHDPNSGPQQGDPLGQLAPVSPGVEQDTPATPVSPGWKQVAHCPLPPALCGHLGRPSHCPGGLPPSLMMPRTDRQKPPWPCELCNTILGQYKVQRPSDSSGTAQAPFWHICSSQAWQAGSLGTKQSHLPPAWAQRASLTAGGAFGKRSGTVPGLWSGPVAAVPEVPAAPMPPSGTSSSCSRLSCRGELPRDWNRGGDVLPLVPAAGQKALGGLGSELWLGSSGGEAEVTGASRPGWLGEAWGGLGGPGENG